MNGWQTAGVVFSLLLASGSLVVAILSYRHTTRSARENAEAVEEAQKSADDANVLNKERLHAEVLPTPAGVPGGSRKFSF